MQPSTIVILIVCILALASLLYGVLRKFSRMGWAAWQILFAWCITMTLDWLPEDASDGGRMAVGLAVFFGAVVGTLALGGAVRLAMLKRKTPAHPAWRFFDRVLGGITALLDYAVMALVVAGPVLTFCATAITPPSFFGNFFESGLWTNFLGKFALDLFLITIFFFAMRAGWRVGFARTLVIFIMMTLTLGCLVLAVFLTVAWGPMTKFAVSIGNAISGIDSAIGLAIGYTVVTLLLFVVFFILICVLGYFIVKLIRHIRFHYSWGFLDGVLGLAMAFAIVLVGTFAFYYLACALSNGAIFTPILSALDNVNIEQAAQYVEQIRQLIQTVTEYAEGLQDWLKCGPVSDAFRILCMRWVAV